MGVQHRRISRQRAGHKEYSRCKIGIAWPFSFVLSDMGSHASIYLGSYVFYKPSLRVGFQWVVSFREFACWVEKILSIYNFTLIIGFFLI